MESPYSYKFTDLKSKGRLKMSVSIPNASSLNPGDELERRA
jgi:hypothetical protein